jgi:hypothetical protein
MRFNFLSSQTARPDAPTAYGRSKWKIEVEVLGQGGWVIRPGLVYGGPEQGLFGNLVNMVRQLPLLPAFIPEPMVQPIHVDDLVEGLVNIVGDPKAVPGAYNLAAETPCSFTAFLRAISVVRLRSRRFFLPVPTVIFLPIVELAGRLVPSFNHATRIKSLLSLPVLLSKEDNKRLGLRLRSLDSGMHPSGNSRHRLLLIEANCLYRYILGNEPGLALLRRYVRAVELLCSGKALSIPKFFYRWPAALILLDSGKYLQSNPALNFRLNSATVLGEASPLGAQRFLAAQEKVGIVGATIEIIKAIFLEVICRISRVLLAPLLSRLVHDMDRRADA